MSSGSDHPAAAAATEHVLEATSIPGVHLRRGTRADADSLLALFDGATSWLNEQGRTGQWGTLEQARARENREERMADMAGKDLSWLAVTNAPAGSSDPSAAAGDGDADGAGKQESEQQRELVIGVTSLGEASDYVPPATEPELYVKLLLTDRGWKGKGLGTLLLEKAREEARKQGVSVLRVDCYAGEGGKLVKWYESQGFEKTDSFLAKGTWPGQVLVQRL